MDVERSGIRAWCHHLTTPGGRLHINPCILSDAITGFSNINVVTPTLAPALASTYPGGPYRMPFAPKTDPSRRRNNARATCRHSTAPGPGESWPAVAPRREGEAGAFRREDRKPRNKTTFVERGVTAKRDRSRESHREIRFT